MHRIFIIVSGQIREAEAEIDGEIAAIPLPFGQYKRVKFPGWQATREEAEAELVRRREARLDRLRKQLAAAEAK